MNVYGTKQIRNVVLLGHGGAGKTTAAEAMALVTGVTKRMGKIADGSTISDYDKEEVKRQFSISTSLVPLEYNGENGPIKINLLDTPGYFDFVGEVEEAMSVADAAIIVVNCKAGEGMGAVRGVPAAQTDFRNQYGRRSGQLPRTDLKAGEALWKKDRSVPGADPRE